MQQQYDPLGNKTPFTKSAYTRLEPAHRASDKEQESGRTESQLSQEPRGRNGIISKKKVKLKNNATTF